MENKFTRGIQERQQRIQQTEHESINSEEIIPQAFPNLDQYIEKTQTRKAKNKTFYLDIAVLEALKKASENQKIAESKLVNDILKKVLINPKNH